MSSWWSDTRWRGDTVYIPRRVISEDPNHPDLWDENGNVVCRVLPAYYEVLKRMWLADKLLKRLDGVFDSTDT